MGIDNPVHLIFLAAVALLVLGPRRLPEVARSLGKGIREFREAMSEGLPGGLMHEHHNGVPGGVPVSGATPTSAAVPMSATAPMSADAPMSATATATAPMSGMAPPPDAEVVADHGPPTGGGGPASGSGWGVLHTDIQDIPAVDGAVGNVDPVEPVRSGDAPDRRPL